MIDSGKEDRNLKNLQTDRQQDRSHREFEKNPNRR